MSVHSLGGVSRNGSWKVAPRVAAMRLASPREQCFEGSSDFKVTTPPSVERQSKAVQVPRASDTRELEKTRQSISKSTAVSRCLSRKQIVQPHRNLITDKHYNHIVAASSVTKTSEAITSRQHASFDGLCCPASSSFSRDPAGSNNPEGTDRYCAKADEDRSAEASAGTNCATSTPLCFLLEPASPGHEAWTGQDHEGTPALARKDRAGWSFAREQTCICKLYCQSNSRVRSRDQPFKHD